MSDQNKPKSLSEGGTKETSPEQIAVAIAEGRLAMHQVPRSLEASAAAAVRRRAAELFSSAQGNPLRLDHVGRYSFDATRAATQNCENLAGGVQVPLGFAGPLLVHGDAVQGESVLLPLATTEGALVASTNRGCRAISQAGGARVWVEDVGMTRAPVFRAKNLEEARRFVDFVRENEGEIRALAEQSSRFLKVAEIAPKVLGTTIFLRFRCTTGDAMGMNMITIACDRVVRELLEPRTGVVCVALSGNYCVDKKAAAVNFDRGRGKSIWAEVLLPAEVLATTLKSRSDLLAEVQLRKNLHGSIAAGSLGFNAQYANILAALFLATGQDLAHVVEGSMGMTHVEVREDGAAYMSVYLPDVPVAAIGGGTGLGTQAECLALLGIQIDPQRPGFAARRLAEITGAAVLAGELSLMAAFTSNDLARAHARLGRAPGATAELT